MTPQQESEVVKYLNCELMLEATYLNYLDKCNDPNETFNKFLERTYKNDQMGQVKIR